MKRLIGLFLVLSLILGIGAQAQTAPFFNALSTAGVFPQADTVTNTATGTIQCRLLKDILCNNTVIQVNVIKISGTVGGTMTLEGSLNGTNWSALRTPDTQTALPTITATDATASYHWRLAGSPFLFYRVSWVGTGTMSASFSGLIYRNK